MSYLESSVTLISPWLREVYGASFSTTRHMIVKLTSTNQCHLTWERKCFVNPVRVLSGGGCFCFCPQPEFYFPIAAHFVSSTTAQDTQNWMRFLRLYMPDVDLNKWCGPPCKLLIGFLHKKPFSSLNTAIEIERKASDKTGKGKEFSTSSCSCSMLCRSWLYCSKNSNCFHLLRSICWTFIFFNSSLLKLFLSVLLNRRHIILSFLFHTIFPSRKGVNLKSKYYY